MSLLRLVIVASALAAVVLAADNASLSREHDGGPKGGRDDVGGSQSSGSHPRLLVLLGLVTVFVGASMLAVGFVLAWMYMPPEEGPHDDLEAGERTAKAPLKDRLWRFWRTTAAARGALIPTDEPTGYGAVDTTSSSRGNASIPMQTIPAPAQAQPPPAQASPQAPVPPPPPAPAPASAPGVEASAGSEVPADFTSEKIALIGEEGAAPAEAGSLPPAPVSKRQAFRASKGLQ